MRFGVYCFDRMHAALALLMGPGWMQCQGQTNTRMSGNFHNALLSDGGGGGDDDVCFVCACVCGGYLYGSGDHCT